VLGGADDGVAHARCMLIMAVLVEDGGGHPAARVADEFDLRVDDLEEELRLRFRKQLQLGLSGELRRQMIIRISLRSLESWTVPPCATVASFEAMSPGAEPPMLASTTTVSLSSG
jgi:hypothetical protein